MLPPACIWKLGKVIFMFGLGWALAGQGWAGERWLGSNHTWINNFLVPSRVGLGWAGPSGNPPFVKLLSWSLCWTGLVIFRHRQIILWIIRKLLSKGANLFMNHNNIVLPIMCIVYVYRKKIQFYLCSLFSLILICQYTWIIEPAWKAWVFESCLSLLTFVFLCLPLLTSAYLCLPLLTSAYLSKLLKAQFHSKLNHTLQTHI